MHRFWTSVIEPLLVASAASRILEIGAETGRHSTRLARWGKANGSELHVIDPAPGFDTEAFAARWGPSVSVHVARSLDVLPRLPAQDVVLIDGDHNWHTVYHELAGLIGPADTPARPLPIVVLHDTAWPWGRRDSYYDLESIPIDNRQPAAVGPIGMRSSGFDPYGMSVRIPVAKTAGGPRNGVRTAIEDALAGQEDQFRVLWLEAMSGLCIIVPRVCMQSHPALEKLLDELTPSPRQRALLQQMEFERIEGQMAMLTLDQLQGEVAESPVDIADRPLATKLSPEIWREVQAGTMGQTYKGRGFLLSPFDVYNYMNLIETLRPKTIFEIGTHEGGRAVWMADLLRSLEISGQVIAVDLVAPKPFQDDLVEVVIGNALELEKSDLAKRLGDLPRPWLVIEDAAHTFDVSSAVLDFFDPYLDAGDFIVVEDGNLGSLMDVPESSPPHEAVKAFLKRSGQNYRLETGICDRFGYNVTANPNGWLRRL